ncbi:C40 family peptidase [Actinoplanes sp. TBRC 11911]|uniref:C40 family peptidase n=1 Tax=Actinoplanes sp. TBRC 11911 TaxID=2729386 RepID=UPI00200709A4|nr:NlpC/P60 family protein [Actinoplanes sp. TBRC 11911]
MAQRASRASARRGNHLRRASELRTAERKAVRRAAREATRARAREARWAREARAAHRGATTPRRATRHIIRRTHVVRSVVTRHAVVKRGHQVVRVANGMTAVIAYAKSQVGRRYVSGGEGRGGFDCSGLTKRAYAQAGVRLPHSSRAQAARARVISRSKARPGDLVVGSGHVGIYMGRGMMIDAGNHRTGVVYRKLYSGLRVARF